MKRQAIATTGFSALFWLAACAQPNDPNLPDVVVYKSASCNCCKLWAQHLRNAGFSVTPRNTDNLNAVKHRVGVPTGMGSCHTAKVGGYFVEGHVPIEDIKRLLRERPDAKGLTVPGMPIGSPGMEVPSGETEPYEVFLVAHDGSTTVFSRHGSKSIPARRSSAHERLNMSAAHNLRYPCAHVPPQKPGDCAASTALRMRTAIVG